MFDHLEPLHGVVALLDPHSSLAPQQIRMPQHLAERQKRLRHCIVAPQHLRQLTRRPWLLGDQRVELLGAPLVQRESLVDQLGVAGERVAVAGSTMSRSMARVSRIESM